MAIKFEYEKRNRAVSHVKGSIQYIANTSSSKEEVCSRLREILPSDMKIGYGGSHVWVKNPADERVLIITWE